MFLLLLFVAMFSLATNSTESVGRIRMKRHRKFSYLVGGPPLHSLRGHSLGVNCAAHFSDGRIITGGRDGTARVWSHGEVVSVFSDHADAILDIAAHPTSGTFATCSADHSILVYTPEGLADELVAHADAVKRIRLASSTTLLSAGLDGAVCIHDLRNAAGTATVVVNTADHLFSLAVGAHDGKYSVFCGSANGHIYVFDPRSPPNPTDSLAPAIRAAHKSCVRDLLLVDGGGKLVSCGSDSMVKLWDARMLRGAVSCTLHSDAVFSLAAVPNSNVLLSGSRDGTVCATNLSQMTTSLVISKPFPVMHLSVSPRTNTLFVCTTTSTVDGYVLSNLLSSADVAVPGGSPAFEVSPSSADVATPSKISLDVDVSREHVLQPTPLLLVDSVNRKYESRCIRPVAFDSLEQQQQWCSSSATSRPTSVSLLSEPDVLLQGDRGSILSVTLLNDKCHAVTRSESGAVDVWNIVDQKVVHRFPQGTLWTDAVRAAQVDTHCASWCTVECRWGCICVTLSVDSSLDSFVNRWWMEYVQPFSLSSAAASTSVGSGSGSGPGRPLSIFTIPRKTRQELAEHPLLNIAEIAVKNVFEKKTATIVVWNILPSNSPYLPAGKRMNFDANTEDVVHSIPSWVSALLTNPKQVLNPSSSGATHAVELQPFQKSLPSLKQTQHNIPRRKTVGDLAIELVATLRVKLPKTRDLLQQLSRSSTSVSFPFGDESPADVSLTPLLPDEFIEFLPAGEDGQPNPSVPVDPMMMVSTAFFVFKEKGSAVLRLWYRKNQLLPL